MRAKQYSQKQFDPEIFLSARKVNKKLFARSRFNTNTETNGKNQAILNTIVEKKKAKLDLKPKEEKLPAIFQGASGFGASGFDWGFDDDEDEDDKVDVAIDGDILADHANAILNDDKPAIANTSASFANTSIASISIANKEVENSNNSINSISLSQSSISDKTLTYSDDFAKYRDIMGITELCEKIDNANCLQKETLQIVTDENKKTITNIKETGKMQLAEFAKLRQAVDKVIEEQDEMQKLLQTSSVSLNCPSMIKEIVQKSINTSFSNNTSMSSMNQSYNRTTNDKIDGLTKFLRSLKLDQRIITVYKKIDRKLNELKESHESTEQIQHLLQSIQSKQEQHSKLIDDALDSFRDSFEDELTQIMAFISHSPIKRERNCNNNDNKDINTNYNEAIDINCNRLNEMLISEFVIILSNNLSTAADINFNKLFLIIIKIIHSLIYFQWQPIKCNDTNAVNNKIQSIVIEYKSEIDNVFRSIFQSVVNNVIKDLIPDQINRVKLQTRITKLTNKLQKNNNQNNNENNSYSKEIIKEFNHISVKLTAVPFGGGMLFGILIAILIAYFFIPGFV